MCEIFFSFLASSRKTIQLVTMLMSLQLLFSRSRKMEKSLAGIGCFCSSCDGVVVSLNLIMIPVGPAGN